MMFRFRVCLVFGVFCFGLLSSYTQEAKEVKAPLCLKGHEGRVLAVSFHPDGKILVSAGVDKTIRLWEVGSGKNIATLNAHESPVTAIAFSSNGRNLASVSEDSIKWWDFESREVIGTYLGRSKRTKTSFRGARTLVVRPDSKAVFWGVPWSVNLWEMGKDTEVQAASSPEKLSIFYVLNLPGAKLRAVNIIQPNIEVWNLSPVKRISRIKADDYAVFCATLSPDGKILASGSLDNFLGLWEVSTGKKIASHQQPGQVVSLAFSPDGQTLALSCKINGNPKNGPIFLVRVRTGKTLATLNRSAPIGSVAFSPDGNTLASAAIDGRIKLWDVSALANGKN